MSKSQCSGQCHGCAYKHGGAANLEPSNMLRGFFTALGGFPFFCHESMGWKDGADGYANDPRAMIVLCSKKTLIQAGASPTAIEREIASVRKNLRVCRGWQASVRRLKRAGWFKRMDIARYRRLMAKEGAVALDEFLGVAAIRTRDWVGPNYDAKTLAQAKRFALKKLRMYIEFFCRDATDSGVSIAFLLKSAPAKWTAGALKK